MELLHHIYATGLGTIIDVLPIVGVIVGFQVLVLRKRPPHLGRVVIGFVYVVLGLVLFLIGLEEALFPLGATMAEQLTAPDFVAAHSLLDSLPVVGEVRWQDYYWVYLFAAAVGLATTIAEPSVIAVAMKANEVSGGTVGIWGLRLAIAVGVSVGVAIGSYRIVAGLPLQYFLMAGYAVVLLQTLHAQRRLTTRTIIPLAYDSGGVTTSTVTVPLVAALGLGLASTIPGRSTLIDGFGLIAFASVFPIISVLAYAQLGAVIGARKKKSSDSRARKEIDYEV
jgi:hypothetical protein